MVYSKEYKQVIAFEYPCYICGNVLSKARQALNHIEIIHGFKLPARSVGHRRPENPNFVYNSNPRSRKDFEVYHYSCTSCWFHCVADDGGLTQLADHVNEAHKPNNVDHTKNDIGQLRSNQVVLASRYKNLPETGDNNKNEESESEDQLTDDYEDEEMDKPKPKVREKKINQKSINDIYQKLNDLTELFQYLFTKEAYKKHK
jgi:hypothetical protein